MKFRAENIVYAESKLVFSRYDEINKGSLDFFYVCIVCLVYCFGRFCFYRTCSKVKFQLE